MLTKIIWYILGGKGKITLYISKITIEAIFGPRILNKIVEKTATTTPHLYDHSSERQNELVHEKV